jgi:hypothetical protein
MNMQNNPDGLRSSKVIASGETDMESIRARVHGELVQLAIPVLKLYHSDLYRDAVWMQKYVTEETPTPYHFFFGVRNTGTSIGTDLTLVRYGNTAVYCVTLVQAQRIELRIERESSSGWTEVL